MARLIITAVVAYAPPMFFSNFLAPICIIHMPNISSIDIVNSVFVVPLNMPVQMINDANKNTVFDWRSKVQFVNFAIHLVCVVTIGFFSALFGRKYPGNHNISKLNGIEQMIFHKGIFIVRARRKQAHNPIITMPSTYNETSTKHTAKINANIAPPVLRIILNN